MKKFVPIILAMFFITSCDTLKEITTTNTNKIIEDTAESQTEILEKINSAILGDIGENEAITNVSIEDKKILINVSLASSYSFVFPEDIADNRFASITDSILGLNIDNLWETITIDFGDIGYITCDKTNIIEDEYGRYFTNFYLQSK